MKKILIGVASLGLASLALAGKVDPAAAPKDGTNVFTNDQKGCIAIEGKLVKAPEPPKTKYVVFAQSGSDVSDVLKLTDFTVTADPKKAGFKNGSNPTIEVRKVEGSEMVPLGEENVEFSVRNKTADNLVGLKKLEGIKVKDGESVKFDIYQLMPEIDVLRVLALLNERHSFRLGENGYNLNGEGVFVYKTEKSSTEQEYHVGRSLRVTNKGAGTIVIEDAEAIDTIAPMGEEQQKELSEGIVEIAPSINGGSEVVICIK